MKQQEFENLYTESWNHFETSINDLRQKKTKPSPQFPEQYRQICSQLSLARQRHYSDNIIKRLNNLVMEGHHILYQKDNRFPIKQLARALDSFVTSLRQNNRFVLLSALLLVIPGLLAGLLSYLDETIIFSLISPEQVKHMEEMYDPARDKIGRDRGSETDLAMFGHYIKNNIGIAFQTFAGGIFLGLGSIFFLCYNGLYIGAIAGRLTSVGYSVTFYPFVIGHGAFELTAIVFSGAAGLMIGYSLINPGNLPRIKALRKTAREAVKIIYGATFMLLIAAFLEAFWSSSTQLAIQLKLGIGAILWLLVFWFCFLSPFGERRHESD
ncbi:stage II sporulation protein M [Neptuniibacter sp.]|uniref:stage II sporulation protein M n=1 Tax=Neptuniibacter sp. TaxID=1962643 RepID=UPI00260AE51E|nr:stage II sporulation protein M [Neptuniibacter sp.]MCP4597236.1 stage II sporulation protein M [Neptuniibacter sp.]